jgi:hypothetical protein
MEVSNQRHAPAALSPGKETPVPTEDEAKEKNLCSCQDSNLSRPARGLVTILTELSWHQSNTKW